MPFQFTLCRKSDADLISFFKQQDVRAASLVVSALCAYIQGTKLSIELNPVIVTEQQKDMNIYIGVTKELPKRKETEKRAAIRKMLISFQESIPTGLFTMYVKGILRYTFGHIIYQTEIMTPQTGTLYSNPELTPPLVKTSTFPQVLSSESIKTKTDIPDSIGSDDDDDDVFDLFESML